MRKLSLNASALNDFEYDLYTTSLRDIALADDNSDDAFYESLTVGVREVRAWLRGRYNTLDASVIDTILKLFSPSLAQTDTLVGSEFFAVLRLVLHALDGKDVDRSLAFTQPTRPGQNPFKQNSNNPFAKPPLPPRKPPPPVPPFAPPPRHVSLSSSTRHRPDRSLSPSKQPLPPPIPPPKPSHHVTSNLIKQSLHASKVAQSLKKAEEQLEKERVLQVLKSSSGSIPHVSSTTTTATTSKLLYPTSANTSSGSDSAAPPLPRRRTHQPNMKSPSPPLSASSMEQVALAGSAPPAAKGLVSPFRSPPADVSSFAANAPPPTHPDRKPHLVGLGRKETFDSIYGTDTLPSPFGPLTPTRSTSSSTDPATDSPTTRVFRSKSLHHPSPPTLHRSGSVHATSTSTTSSLSSSHAPPPPARRKRPESFQVLPGSTPKETLLSRSLHHATSGSSPPSRPPPPPPPSLPHHHRRSSLSSTPSNHTSSSYSTAATHATNESPFTNPPSNPLSMSHLQRTLSTLQPKLEKARYKAEAGLSKRGFVSRGLKPRAHGQEQEEEEGLVNDDGGLDDSDEESSFARRRGRTSTRVKSKPKDVFADAEAREPRYFSSDEEDELNASQPASRARFVGGGSLSPSPSPERRHAVTTTKPSIPSSPLKPSFGRAHVHDPPEQDGFKWPVDVQNEGWRPL